MKTTKPSIQLATDLGSYFKDQVFQTARKQGVEVTPHTLEYLSRVLERFSHTQNYVLKKREQIEKATLNGNIEPTSPTMATVWLESFSLDLSQQFFHLQSLGDFALFTCGYFGDHVRGSLVDQDYYCAIGGQAYERAGKIRESISAEKTLNTFFELAERFKNFAEIFEELSDQALLTTDKDALKLYQKWLALKSARIARMLAENGIIANDSQRARGQLD